VDPSGNDPFDPAGLRIDRYIIRRPLPPWICDPGFGIPGGSLVSTCPTYEVTIFVTTIILGRLRPQPEPERCPLVAPSGNYTIQPNSPTPIHAIFAPEMASALGRAFENLNAQGITPMITDGFRTRAEQLDRYRNARFGRVPTGLHQIGLAVDINSNDPNFEAIKNALTAEGLTWGGTFNTPDPVHFQLAPGGTAPDPRQLAACEREHPTAPDNRPRRGP
jgi:hypothetical protein